ncbi:MAG: AI-2E family transporter [Planctomycetota bacterium]
MLERLSKTHRNIAFALLAALLAWIAWALRDVLNPLILGYLLAYVLRPAVLWLERKGMGRKAAVNIIFGAFALIATISVVVVAFQAEQVVARAFTPAPGGEDPVAAAERRIDEVLEDIDGWWNGVFGDEEATGEEAVPPSEPEGEPLPEEATAAAAALETIEAAEEVAEEEEELTVRRLLRSWAKDLGARVEATGGLPVVVGSVFGFLRRLFGGVMSVFGFVVLLPVYTYFLLFELERIHDFIRGYVPKAERERVTRIARKIGSVIANFFRGRLLICFLKGLVIAAGLAIAGVPHGFLLGMTSGFLSLVPFVGPMIGFVVTYLIGLQSMEVVEALLWIAPIFVIAETLEGYVLIPKILGDSLGLHPVVILVAVFAGGSALGLFGFLIAVPLAATVIILVQELVMPAVRDFAEEDSHVDGPPGATEGG